MKTQRGFTITELLVVIGLIALLIALLLPVLKQARAAANKVKCAGQLSDLGKGFQMYLNDSKGRLPQVNGMPLRTPVVVAYPSVLEVFNPYVNSRSLVWRCPSDVPVNVDSLFPADADSYHTAYGLSYEYNSWMNMLHGGGTFQEALSTAKKAPYFVDTSRFRIFNDFSFFHGKPGQMGNMNFLFADWSVGDIGEALSSSDFNKPT
jgi:prepilin-type N-terminal cleavage/methylation domain-containing protein/prepilin-type processing-associated H-X9-DG protein